MLFSAFDAIHYLGHTDGVQGQPGNTQEVSEPPRLHLAMFLGPSDLINRTGMTCSFYGCFLNHCLLGLTWLCSSIIFPLHSNITPGGACESINI